MSDPREPELVALLKKIQYDLTALKVNVSEAQRMAAGLDLPDPDEHKCPECGVVWHSVARLSEHRYYSHGGPVPEHMLAIEAIADDPVDEPDDEAQGEAEAA